MHEFMLDVPEVVAPQVVFHILDPFADLQVAVLVDNVAQTGVVFFNHRLGVLNVVHLLFAQDRFVHHDGNAQERLLFVLAGECVRGDPYLATLPPFLAEDADAQEVVHAALRPLADQPHLVPLDDTRHVGVVVDALCVLDQVSPDRELDHHAAVATDHQLSGTDAVVETQVQYFRCSASTLVFFAVNERGEFVGVVAGFVVDSVHLHGHLVVTQHVGSTDVVLHFGQ